MKWYTINTLENIELLYLQHERACESNHNVMKINKDIPERIYKFTAENHIYG